MLLKSAARLMAVACLCAAACGAAGILSPQTARADGLIAKGDYFPIGVWLQNPRNAEKYKAIGINVYVGLDRGPTGATDRLRKAGITVACAQNKVALEEKWNKEIVGWLQNDEPDNAQALKNKKGYGPPILPEAVVARSKELKAADKEGRPVMLNLGMGVAWDGWFGRGTRSNKPEDYPEYVKGGDVLSFDIYPAATAPEGRQKAIAGKLSFVGNGVKRLVGWVDNKKPVWSCIETTHISDPNNAPTPKQVRDEVWMAIINGARGILYFAHQFKPNFVEAGLLANPEIVAAVKNVDAQVQQLARVINEGTPIDGVTVDEKKVTVMTRQLNGEKYIFAVGMDAGPLKATFTVPGLAAGTKLEVFGESRQVDSAGGKWADTFTGYEAHIYKVARPK